MPTKKEDTEKKVTEIENAKVTIEVEETKETPKTDDEPQAEAEDSEAPQKDELKKDESENVLSDLNSDSSSGGFGWKKVIISILIIVPIGFLAFGGFLYFSKNMNLNLNEKKSEKKLVIPEGPTATPTPKPVDKEEFEIEVQNGSGITGEGAKVADLLESAGFSVGDIGNADASDYEETVITVSEEVSDEYIDELTKTLEKRGEVGKVEKFATGEDGEVLVIVGSDTTGEDEEATPTP